MGTQRNHTLPTRKPLGDANINSHDRTVASTNSGVWNARSWWSMKPLTFGWHRNGGTLGPPYSADSATARTRADLERIPDPVYIVIICARRSSISAILSQVGGGPLRKILSLQQQPFPVVYLEFIHARHTKYFREQVEAGKCIVSGTTVKVCPPHTLDTVLSVDPHRLESFKRALISNSRHQVQLNRERKALRDRNRSSTTTQQHLSTLYPDPEPVLPSAKGRRTLEIRQHVNATGRLLSVNVSPGYLMAIFRQMGPVLQVRPMFVTEHIAFSIQYASVSAAVQAMEQFQRELATDRAVRQEHRELNVFAGLHSWTLNFFDDPAEHTFYF